MDALDEITDEINNIQIENSSAPTGQRGVVSDIEKLKKIAKILETVGQAVLPAVVDGQINAQKSAGINGNAAYGGSGLAAVAGQSSSAGNVVAGIAPEPGNVFPKGFKRLQQQHHNTLTPNNDVNGVPLTPSASLVTQEDK